MSPKHFPEHAFLRDDSTEGVLQGDEQEDMVTRTDSQRPRQPTMDQDPHPHALHHH
jgi:hypothetical protein